MVQIRTPTNQRIFPLWNTLGLANAVGEATGATNFGTYFGHSPTAEQAFDSFSIIPMPRTNRVLGDAIADFILYGKMPNGVSVWDFFGVRYIIWRQHINWRDGNGWIAMADRNGDTNNHFDHDHVSVNVIPKPSGLPAVPSNVIGGSELHIINVKDTGIFLLRGDKISHLQHPDHVFEWVRAGASYNDKAVMSAAIFKAYTGWGTQQGIMSAAKSLMGSAGLGDEEDTNPEEAQKIQVREANELMATVRAGMDAIYDEYVKELQVK